MHLSTSISDCKRGAALLLAVAVCTYLLSLFYVLFVSPPSLEQRAVRQLKRRYAAELDRGGVPKVVFVGGSSTTYGVMPSAIKEDSGISAVNAGLNAGMGSGFLMLWGLFLCNPGDTMVLMIEPGLLSDPYSQPMSHSIAEVELPLKYWTLKKKFVNGNLWKARPRFGAIKTSGEGLTGMLGLMCRGRGYPYYWTKYMAEDGFLSMPLKVAPPTPETLDHIRSARLDLSEDGLRALAWISTYCQENSIRVCYVFPKVLVDPDAIELYNVRAQRLAESISRHILVLGPLDCATSDGRLFYDSTCHLNADAAQGFSVDLGRRLVKAGLAVPTTARSPN